MNIKKFYLNNEKTQLIKQMIGDGVITEDQAVVGFVAAFPTSEVISGYTAFILGVRSVVPTAVMRVS